MITVTGLLASQSDPVPVFLLGGFGLLILAIVVAALREAIAMKSWPVAKGRILESKVEEYQQSAGSSGTYAGSRARMTLYRPVVRYQYEVEGKRFQGDRIAQSPGWNRGVADFATAVAQRYPVGSAVDVRYNPKRPDEAVLEPRVPRSWIFALVIALALLGLALRMYFR
jgi:hypothetical protein